MPHVPRVWFIDRSLGRHDVANALRGVGARVVVHDDQFAQDADDEVWLAAVGRNGWIAISGDKSILKSPAEKVALGGAGVGIFFVEKKGMTGPAIGSLLAKLYPKMARLAEKYTRPFVFTISGGGTITLKVGARRGGVKR